MCNLELPVTEQIRQFPATHWGPYVRRITRNFCLCRIPLCIIILLIMLHMKSNWSMNHVLVSLGINNWGRVHTASVGTAGLREVLNWQILCMSAAGSSEQSCTFIHSIEQSRGSLPSWVNDSNTRNLNFSSVHGGRGEFLASLQIIQVHVSPPFRFLLKQCRSLLTGFSTQTT